MTKTTLARAALATVIFASGTPMAQTRGEAGMEDRYSTTTTTAPRRSDLDSEAGGMRHDAPPTIPGGSGGTAGDVKGADPTRPGGTGSGPR
jgi:hypothetical protein